MENFQDLPESQRADAVSSMVYEASARIRDPVYGCAGAICQLQKQVSDLQAQLAKAQAEVVNMQCQQANLVALICMEMTQAQEPILQQHQYIDTSCFLDENNLGTSWEPLWTWSTVNLTLSPQIWGLTDMEKHILKKTFNKVMIN